MIKTVKKKGFTLAEILVSVSVVGIIAALTIPVITNVAPNNNKVLLKKSYFSFSKAINDMILDETNYPSTEVGTEVGTSPALSVPRGFNYTVATTNGSTNKFCYLLSQELNTVGTISCPARTSSGVGRFTTSDGIDWIIAIFNNDTQPDSQFPIYRGLTPGTYGSLGWSKIAVIVDVNGVSKGPNCTNDTDTSLWNNIDLHSIWASVANTGLNYINCTTLGTATDKSDIFPFSARFDGKISLGSPYYNYSSTAHSDPLDDAKLKAALNNK